MEYNINKYRINYNNYNNYVRTLGLHLFYDNYGECYKIILLPLEYRNNCIFYSHDTPTEKITHFKQIVYDLAY